jgi:D-sedoheptulose 7-phosphate isomerase
LIHATNIAKQMNLRSVGLLGFDGGKLAKVLDFSLVITTEKGKYGPVEDIHLMICHAISELVLTQIE